MHVLNMQCDGMENFEKELNIAAVLFSTRGDEMQSSSD
jgi:hypothetical protein